MFPLVGVFMAGIVAGAGAKVGTEIVYPWLKDNAGKAWDSYKGIVCNCEEEVVDFNTDK